MARTLASHNLGCTKIFFSELIQQPLPMDRSKNWSNLAAGIVEYKNIFSELIQQPLPMVRSKNWPRNRHASLLLYDLPLEVHNKIISDPPLMLVFFTYPFLPFPFHIFCFLSFYTSYYLLYNGPCWLRGKQYINFNTIYKQPKTIAVHHTRDCCILEPVDRQDANWSCVFRSQQILVADKATTILESIQYYEHGACVSVSLDLRPVPAMTDSSKHYPFFI